MRKMMTDRFILTCTAIMAAVVLVGCSKVNNAAATVPDTSVSETSGEGIVSTEETTTAEKSTEDGKDSTSSVENETTTAENTDTETTTSGRDGTGSGTEEKTSRETETTINIPSETTTEARTEKQTETTTQGQAEKATEKQTEKQTETQTEQQTEKQTEKQTESESTTQTPKHEHSYSPSVTKNPTCTEEGVRTYSCSCGNAYTESISANGHSFGSYTYNNDATYDADGTETATCSVCGAKDTRTASGTKLVHTHNYTSAVTKETTTTETGIMTYTCTCGDSYTEVIPMIEHEHTASQWRTGYHEDGRMYEYKYCTTCGDWDAPYIGNGSPSENTIVLETRELPSWYDEHPDKPLNVATGGMRDGSLEMYFTSGGIWTRAADGCWDFDYSATDVLVGKYAEGWVSHGYLYR